MLSIHTARNVLQRELRTHLDRSTMNAAPVVMTWDTAAKPANPNKESDYATSSLMSAVVTALVYYVDVKATQSQWTDFQEGDAIVTFDGDAFDLDGKRTVSFILPDGFTYAQAKTDRDPVEFWSSFVSGSPLTKTLLLRRSANTLRLGQVYFVDVGGSRLPLYTYDFDAQIFAALDSAALAGRALIDTTTANQLTISIAGVPSLRATASQVQAAAFTDGITILLDQPRLEFWLGALRCASLSSAALATRQRVISVSDPAAANAFRAGNPGWLFSLTQDLLTAPGFAAGALS